jgi:hypothetical protein
VDEDQCRHDATISQPCGCTSSGRASASRGSESPRRRRPSSPAAEAISGHGRHFCSRRWVVSWVRRHDPTPAPRRASPGRASRRQWSHRPRSLDAIDELTPATTPTAASPARATLRLSRRVSRSRSGELRRHAAGEIGATRRPSRVQPTGSVPDTAGTHRSAARWRPRRTSSSNADDWDGWPSVLGVRMATIAAAVHAAYGAGDAPSPRSWDGHPALGGRPSGCADSTRGLPTSGADVFRKQAISCLPNDSSLNLAGKPIVAMTPQTASNLVRGERPHLRVIVERRKPRLVSRATCEAKRRTHFRGN